MSSIRSRSGKLVLIIVVGIIALSMYYVAGRQKHKYSYLALGDSYTYGSYVKPAENYPNKTAQLLREQHTDISDPTMVAQPGWTTAMILNALEQKNITGTYSVVTVLSGTNDLFNGNDTATYKKEFGTLLRKAIEYAGGQTKNVIVLSLPDWTATPYGLKNSRENSKAGIEAYNAACKEIAGLYECRYLDITTGHRGRAGNKEYLSQDGMHPSAKEYAIWAESLAGAMGSSKIIGQ